MSLLEMAVDRTLAKPEGLSKLGEAAYAAILEFLHQHDLDHTGGCKAFYSPDAWKERGEEYGTKSVLIVVYDGGSHRCCFTLSEQQYDLVEKMQKTLQKVGCYFEECTGWYGAVYPETM